MRAFDRESKLGPPEYLAEVLKEKKVDTGNIGLEDECCNINTFKRLQEVLPKARFRDASEIFSLARAVKEPEEIELIRKAVEIGEAAMKVAMDVVKPGIIEMEIQRAVELEMKRLGAFREVETMCQSGSRTANYRAFASEWKKVEENDLIMVDLGCVYKGYGCDITRTWVAGTPTGEQKKIARDLYRVHEQILDFIKPGVKHREVSQFAHEEMARAGYTDDCHSFPHRRFSFHGLGLGPFHDPPDNHHPDVVITPQGVDVMTKLPKELI